MGASVKFHRAKTAREVDASRDIEAWLLDEDDRMKRRRWPTAALAHRLAQRADPFTASVLLAYAFLLDSPLGTEHAIRTLRDLRRAEQTGGFNDD